MSGFKLCVTGLVLFAGAHREEQAEVPQSWLHFGLSNFQAPQIHTFPATVGALEGARGMRLEGARGMRLQGPGLPWSMRMLTERRSNDHAQQAACSCKGGYID